MVTRGAGAGGGAPGRHHTALSTELSQMKIRKKRRRRARKRGERWGRRAWEGGVGQPGREWTSDHTELPVDRAPSGRVQAGRASGVLNPPAHATTNTALRRAGWGRCHFQPSPTVDLQGGDHLEPTDPQPRIPRRPSTIGPTCP